MIPFMAISSSGFLETEPSSLERQRHLKVPASEEVPSDKSKRSRKLPQPSLDQERGRGRQARPVHVHPPLSVLGDGRCSFDQNLDMLIRRKRLLFEEAFMPPEATSNEAEELFTSTVT